MLKNAGGSQSSGVTVRKCKKKKIRRRKEEGYTPSRTVHISELNRIATLTYQSDTKGGHQLKLD